jgi:hypothetical protein
MPFFSAIVHSCSKLKHQLFCASRAKINKNNKLAFGMDIELVSVATEKKTEPEKFNKRR